VIFADVTEQRRLQNDVERSRRELEIAYEELQSTVEELETTNEELQSTNEELETTNEELQSTNEELETMNEELQSTNEELETINDEMRTRSRELDQVNAIFDTVLTSTGLGVIVVDAQGRVVAWDTVSEDLWGLRSDEAVTRELRALDIGLPMQTVWPAVRGALGPDGQRAALAVEARNRRGQAINCEVTIIPMGDERDGVVGGAIVMVAQAAPDGHVAKRAVEAQ
jgi:two-component system CheB/CheR fusion protein